MTRFRWALLASLVASCALAPGAPAAVRAISIDDGIDSQDTSPTLTSHPIYPEVVAAAVAYDDATGSVHGTITFNILTGVGRPVLPAIQLLGATSCSDDASAGATTVPALSIAAAYPSYGPQPPTSTAGLAGYAGEVPVPISISPDGLTATFDTSNPHFAHRDWRCVVGTYNSDYDDDFSDYFAGYEPKDLTTTTATAAVDAELQRRYGDDYKKSDRRTWLKCPSSELLNADAASSDELPTALCQFRFYDTGADSLRHGSVSIALKDGDLTPTYFGSQTFSQKLKTCHVRRNDLTSSPQILDRSLKADGFVSCSPMMVGDLTYNPKPGIKHVGFHGTNQAGFEDAIDFRCRIQRKGSRYTASCANKLGDRFIYAFTPHTKPKKVPHKQAPAHSSCDPNYSGACLKSNVSDYDCAGGSGNGPYYVQGPITVVGDDHYDLDSDNDGTACE